MSDSSSTVHVTTPGHAGAPGQSHEVRLFSVEQDVRGLKGAFGELKTEVSSGFKELGTQIAAKSQPNWHMVTLAASILLAGGSAVWTLFGGYETRTDAAISEQKAAATHFVSREDIADKFASAREIAELKAQLAAGETKRNADDIKALQAIVVPLSTHQEMWAAQREKNKELAALVEENRKALADISAPKETLSRIYKRLDDLEIRGEHR